MTPSRIGLVLLLVVVLFVVATLLRADTARLRADTGMQQVTLTHLRREAWTLQTELARMRASPHLRKRVRRLGLRVGARFDRMLAPASSFEQVAGRLP